MQIIEKKMIEVTNNIFCARVIANNVRSDFFYNKPVDTSYNSYLVKGKKNALIGVVHNDYCKEFLRILEDTIYVSDIDYLIMNCTRTEYSDSINEILNRNPNIQVVGTIPAIKNLKEITNVKFNEHIAKNGDVLDLGGKTIEFMVAPCLPWQDTMITYVSEDKAVFSGRLFSSNYVSEDIFDTDYEGYKTALKDYYKHIFLPYGGFVKKALNLIKSKNTEFIFTSNGAVIKNNIIQKINDYLKLAKTNDTAEVAVFCSKHYKNTLKIANVIADTLKKCHINVCIYDVCNISENTINAMNSAKAVIFGTPTINKNAAKEIWHLLSELDAVNAKNKPYFVFGSYGWSGEGAELVHRYLQQLRLRPFAKPVSAAFTPSETDINDISEYTRRFAESIENNWKEN